MRVKNPDKTAHIERHYGTARIAVSAFILVLCLAVLYRVQISNQFSILAGDRYDSVIFASILEHWFQVFINGRDWTDAFYFYPYKNTIANTDALFLVGLIYTPIRLLGIDQFLGMQLTDMVLKGIGFFGALKLGSKIFGFSFPWASLIAALFVLNNAMTVHGNRIQLATVVFTPWMVIWLFESWTAFQKQNLVRFSSYGIVAGLAFGAWCMTCFYMAWFFILYLTIFVLVLFLFGKNSLRPYQWTTIYSWTSLALVIGIAVLSLVPFAYAFISKKGEVGTRAFEEVLGFTVPPEGFIEVGRENILAGQLVHSLITFWKPDYKPFGEYYNTGFAPLLIVLFFSGLYFSVKRIRSEPIYLYLSALGVSCLVSCLLMLNVGGYSPWILIFNYFPGAKALRVVSAYQILLALPVILVAVKFLATRRWSPAVFLLVCAALVSEEVNLAPIHLDRKVELDRIHLPQAIPKRCQSFYVSGWKNQEELGVVADMYAHNVSAMLIAQKVNVPTINGISSFNPPDWNFGSPNRTDYDTRILSYAKKHDVYNGLCKLDLNDKQWVSYDRPSEMTTVAENSIYFNSMSNWSGRIHSAQGLSGAEPWGTWSIGPTVALRFREALPKKFTLRLKAHAFGPNVGQDFGLHIGNNSSIIKLTAEDMVYNVPLTNLDGSDQLTITVPVPQSPKALGINNDDRMLGIGIVSMEIVEVQ